LELCTPTTGRRFSMIDKRQMVKQHRIVYRCAAVFDDGDEFTFRTQESSSFGPIIDILSSGEDSRYDLVFVDPFHTYAATMTDLVGAFALTRPGGVIVCHDCNPSDLADTSPDFRKGMWCGVTYEAFVDFARTRRGHEWFTVDCDYGCGVLFKGMSGCFEDDILDLAWLHAKGGGGDRYPFFDENRHELLRLVSEGEFREFLDRKRFPK
jgi:hypothetical protein